MKLDSLHKRKVGKALKSNVAVKSMLQPLNRDYYWKTFNKTEKRPEPPTSGVTGGHYDATTEGNPRLKKYFGGYPYGSSHI